MKYSWLVLALAAGALALSLALTFDALLVPGLTFRSVLIRITLLGTAVVACVGAISWYARRTIREQRRVERHLDWLVRQDLHDLDENTITGSLKSLAVGKTWQGLLSRLNTMLSDCRGRMQELEQSRATLEIRARRNESRADRVSSIMAGLPEPVIAIDAYDELVLANPSAEKLFDITANIESRALNRLIHCEKLIELLTDARRRKTPNNRIGEIEIADKDGSAHWYSVSARSIGPAEGDGRDQAAPGAVAVLRDISSQKATQRRNAEFVSAVSHEMKTPLAGIKAYVELLVDGDAEDEETREEFLQVINSQADRLQRLIDNMLNLARIEAGVVSVSKQSRSLNELLEEAFRVVSPSAEAKQIQMSMDLSPLYLAVLVDRDMMSQAAINLLSNAVKYTPNGGKITLRSRSRGDEVRFEVEDSGVGLSAEDCDKVFQKFYRVQKDKDMAAGTGLGLPLAKHIVEDVHGGRLTLESVLGKGSIFGVVLPQVTKGKDKER